MWTLSDIDYTREELRGLFAIGAIASLAAFKSEIEASPFSVAVIMLATFWSLYVFLMAVGISTDILPLSPTWRYITDGSIEVAHATFFLGMVLSLFVVALVLLGYLYSTFTSGTSQDKIVVGSLVVIMSLPLVNHLRRSYC